MTDTAVRGEINLDTSYLLEAYRDSVSPAAIKFVQGLLSASEFREIWLGYFRREFLAYEMSVQDAWRASFGPDGGVAPGAPFADPAYAEVLRHFPVTIGHNNLERLVDVLDVQLNGAGAGETTTPERIVDLAFVVDELDRLMTSLAQT